MKPKRIHASQLSNIKMVAGMERKIDRVIRNGELLEWVAIGWIPIRKATARDKKRYRTVVG